METELLTYKQAAKILQLKMGTLYSLVSQKRIPHVRISGRMVRFKPSELDRWVKSQTVNEKGINYEK